MLGRTEQGLPAYSFIVPVRNRPEHVGRLLASVRRQTVRGERIELILVEDGSTQPATAAVESHRAYFRIRHEFLSVKEGLGPAVARNRGSILARGKHLIFVDSDVQLPRDYVHQIDKHLGEHSDDVFFGGNDDVLPPEATYRQRAIHYAMTSWLGTGGIRGHKRGLGRFCPRTHNMAVRRDVFEKVRGFREDFRYGEDMEFALRMAQQGYSGTFLSAISVAHARKESFRDFFVQVYHSGRARVFLNRLYSGSSHWIHYLPAVCCLLLLFYLFFPLRVLRLFFVVGAGCVGVDGFLRQRSLRVAVLSVGAVLVQWVGYGLGFLSVQLRLGEKIFPERRKKVEKVP